MTGTWIFLLGNITTESIIIAVVGYVVVFASLVLLFWFFNSVPALIRLKFGKRKNKQNNNGEDIHKEEISGETTAAIAMALHLFLSEYHDEESGVLTIKKVSKTYSPWSSKIYSVRNQFNRR